MNAQRYARICEMLARRQPDLTICMEQVHKPHNVSAIIRTADAVGVHEVHAVWPGSRMRTMASAAAGSNSWVQVKTHRTIGDAVAHLKGQGMQILATHLSDKAVDFREIDYTRPTCILMGQGENRYYSGSIRPGGSGYHHSYDRHGTVAERFPSPPRSFFMKPSASGKTRACICAKTACCRKMNSSACCFEGGYPVLAKVAKRKGLPYPRINQQGEIDADADWWGDDAGGRVVTMSGRLLDAVPLNSLTGVGAAQSSKLAKIGLHTVQDLLLHLPLRYEDRTHLYPIWRAPAWHLRYR
ncbi:tRNA (guanosine-2'-O)-methyltransferase [Salmonella enterica subsp. arizonae]|uniref:tRNA (Guanosine-2'-O)-methyltransferase n=1 Tax=Salmonella enterica subsp. arizonae TaxID=59203 RepID=A0A379T336_SALER|nr:tRNA (guanosine-2'-O)-methyltransferase [Salmonella enterica subsp. arizonae]